MHFLKAYDDSYAKMNKEHEYKDEYKDNDRDVERLTESLTVYTSWIRWRLIKPTPPQPSTAQYHPVSPSTAHQSQVLPSTAQYRQIQLTTAQYCPVLPSIAQYRQVQPINA